MHRLFVGLSIPDDIATSLLTLQNGVEGARWRPTNNFHLTLAFIGNTDRHGFNDAIEALATIDAPSFELNLSGLDFFGDRKPRALWVGADTDPALMHLQSKVETALRRKDFDLERRKYIPHVTLAYLKGARRDDVAAYCAVNGLFSSEPFSVNEFHLYSSQMGNEASHYEIEASYALSSSR